MENKQYERSKPLLLISLNINGLNSPIKRQRLVAWIKTHNPTVCCLQETRLRSKDTNRLKVKGWKKIFHANSNLKKAGVVNIRQNKL